VLGPSRSSRLRRETEREERRDKCCRLYSLLLGLYMSIHALFVWFLWVTGHVIWKEKGYNEASCCLRQKSKASNDHLASSHPQRWPPNARTPPLLRPAAVDTPSNTLLPLMV
jgi:hypothetical protein